MASKKNKKRKNSSKSRADPKEGESEAAAACAGATATATATDAQTVPTKGRPNEGTRGGVVHSALSNRDDVSGADILGPSDGGSSESSFESVTPRLSEGVLRYVQTKGFTNMTPVQMATIPLFLTNKDVAVKAVTGSGKTLAFLIPMVEMILRRTVLLQRRQVGAIVLSPTRELARQTFQVASELCKFTPLPPPLLLVGGGGSDRPVSEDLRCFQRLGCDIIVATPGRMEDVLTRYDVVDVSELECLVLDEADVLLDMGFDVTLRAITTHLPKMRRTGLFSATGTGGRVGGGAGMSSAAAATGRRGLKELMSRAGMRNPVYVNVAIATATASPSPPSSEDVKNGPQQQQQQQQQQRTMLRNAQEQATPTTLRNYYLVCPLDEKLSRLVAFLRSHRDDKIIVFFLTCACVEFFGTALKQILRNSDIVLETLHGKLVQKRRDKAMERFRGTAEQPQQQQQQQGNRSDERGTKENADGNDNNGGSGDGGGGGAVLFCTDVAARGLDVSNVHWVVQFDAPQDPAQFVHRVGRTARIGRVGSSLILLTPKEEAYVDFLRNRRVPLAELPPETEGCASQKVDHRVSTRMPPSRLPPQPAQRHEEANGKKTDDADNSNVDDHPIGRSEGDPAESTGDDGDRNHGGTTLPDMLAEVRNLVLSDRDILEKGTKAFTSYVRAFKEHHCAFIFRFAALDLGLLATSFCLLRLPKMPELRDKSDENLASFVPAGPDVNIHAIPFRDRVREEARQKRLAAELQAGGKNAKQIKAEQRRAEWHRKSKERRQAEIDKGRNPDKKRGRRAQLFDEWDELAKEERLYKKLRSKKISKEQYKELLYGSTATTTGGSQKVDDCTLPVESDSE